MSIGEVVGETRPQRRVRDVLGLPSWAKVFCRGPHQDGRRRVVAVLTRETVPHLVTDDEDLEYPGTASDRVLASCESCPVDVGTKVISVAKLKKARADQKAEIWLHEILWTPLGKEPQHP